MDGPPNYATHCTGLHSVQNNAQKHGSFATNKIRHTSAAKIGTL
jgi:hypothetical protein